MSTYSGSVRGKEGGGCVAVEIGDNCAEVARQAKVLQDTGKLDVVCRGVGTFKV